MVDADLAAAVEEALSVDPAEFQRRAREDAALIKDALADGTFDNPQAIVGLEYEFYAVDAETTTLTRVPRRLLEFIRFEKELGLHNAELSTSPLPLNADGLRAQEAEVAAQLRTAEDCVRSEGMGLVSDGMWTIPPTGETARAYLSDSVVDEGIQVATNMSATPRYHAMANADGGHQSGMRLDAPHVSLQADTVMPESLITSIQPHYQVPHAEDLPEYFTYALRIAGPLLALGVNSPLFPPDLYDDVPAEEILADAWMEHRVNVFESALNPVDGPGKVRFPEDLDSVEQAVDRIAADEMLVPMPPSEGSRFDDEFATFRLKHGTYWRWVRPVFGGASRSGANARIEFRPIPAQPTVRDSIAFLAAFAGLMEALPRLEHPVADLDWGTAERNFYAAARSGLEADLRWIANDGGETTDAETIYRDLLNHAADGLRASGLSGEAVGRYLGPLRRRVRYGITPARWKMARVREELADGTPFEEAVYTMQRRYVENQAETLFEADFGAWIEAVRYRAG
jgi:gamma-glutamyl:cysteine ligase YbdK (ATP-grasp superfamily)